MRERCSAPRSFFTAEGSLASIAIPEFIYAELFTQLLWWLWNGWHVLVTLHFGYGFPYLVCPLCFLALRTHFYRKLRLTSSPDFFIPPACCCKCSLCFEHLYFGTLFAALICNKKPQLAACWPYCAHPASGMGYTELKYGDWMVNFCNFSQQNFTVFL